MSDRTNIEPSLFSAAWRYRVLVVGITALAVALGFVYMEVSPPETVYGAQTSMVVQATGGGLDLGAAASADRFVANQIEILKSSAVAQVASELAAQSEPPVVIPAEELLSNAIIGGSRESDLIVVAFASLDPVAAVTGANALAEAFQQLASLETTAATQAAVERIDTQIDTVDARLRTLTAQLGEITGADTVRNELRTQYEEAVAEIVGLQLEARTADTFRVDEIRTRLADLQLLINLYQDITGIGQDNPELDDLIIEQNQLLSRRTALVASRDQLAIDLELAPDIVAYRSDATTAEVTSDSGPGRILAVALILGLLAGVGLAYLLASRRRIFHDRKEPEAVLGAPLLADIPDFAQEGLKTRLPVQESPRSAAAEAFRFATASLELKLASRQARSLVVISATLGMGKSTVLANLALAAAREGNRVLLIDADFGNQDLSALLTGSATAMSPGLTDVISAGIPFTQAIRSIDAGADRVLSLLSRGRQAVVAADLLRSPKVKQLFDTVREEFDLVLVDAPPLLQVAYASTLAAYVDGAMVIVGHGESTVMIEETRTRLALIGVDVFGYVYNRSPLRREMTVSEGSMTDILGDLGATANEPPSWGRGSRKRR
ncbi:MAG TPA: AAA family ATPase [Acidimicrobiia bacterium]|nr:AAA family ATPase [Acidimicrobiia bacterium]